MLAALEFFYPRLSPGGIIFIHDHNHKWEGIQKAVNEFTSHIPETPVLVPDLDGTCMIVKNRRTEDRGRKMEDGGSRIEN
jgi:O-methyltransferase